MAAGPELFAHGRQSASTPRGQTVIITLAALVQVCLKGVSTPPPGGQASECTVTSAAEMEPVVFVIMSDCTEIKTIIEPLLAHVDPGNM